MMMIQVGFSSPAQFGILNDLGLTLAEVPLSLSIVESCCLYMFFLQPLFCWSFSMSTQQKHSVFFHPFLPKSGKKVRKGDL